jgi:serine/threonine protein phosphatase PrpC
VSAFSRPGGRERNEDACGYVERDGIVCCVLADGAGGHGGGDFASQTSVQFVMDGFNAHPGVSASVLRQLIYGANAALLQRQEECEALADMRSTLVVLLFDTNCGSATWGHVGDSRLYLLRDGRIRTRTRDHSLVQTMVDNGMMRPEQAADHPESNVLFTSLGLRDAFQADVLETPYQLNDGDAFLLCSDGVWGAICDTAIVECLDCSSSADEWLRRIEQKVDAQLHDSSDNYSAIAVWCGNVCENMRTQPGPLPNPGK